MAKSKSFFGLRSGSTKSLTFQVYRGEQITKDRVYRVSNPRTEAQMTQRALIPIVAAARSALKGLVDHSFEGVAYGEASLKEFSKQNLRAGALTVTSYSPNGVSNPGFAGLIVSNGSINVPINMGTQEDQTVITVQGTSPIIEFPAAEANADAKPIFTAIEEWARNNNKELLKPGTQLTFLSIYEAGAVKVGAAIGGQDVSTSAFGISRIYIPNGDSDSENAKSINGKWKVSEKVQEGAGEVTLVNDFGDKITFDGGDKSEGSTAVMKIIVQPYEAAKNRAACGMALILSRFENGMWKRNTARLKIDFEPKHIYTFEDWLSTYQTTGAASKKYLNTGDESTGIQG